MEERPSPRLVTQRHLEVDTPPPAVAPPPEPPDRMLPPVVRSPPEAGPSNRGLLERQRRWLRERAKFESKRPDGEGTK